MVVAAKSYSQDPSDGTALFPPNPNSPASTVNTVEREIREAGGEATALPVDTTDYESVKRMVAETIKVRTHLPLAAMASPSHHHQ